MAGRRSNQHEQDPARRARPATTVEARENQMLALAVDLAEKQLREGTASAQVITHYLKLGTQQHELEREKLQAEVQNLRIRSEQAAAATRVETLYAEALDAMRAYSGMGVRRTDDEEL